MKQNNNRFLLLISSLDPINPLAFSTIKVSVGNCRESQSYKQRMLIPKAEKDINERRNLQMQR